MPRSIKPFEFVLTEDEAEALRQPAGAGGHQSFQSELIAQLENGLTITLDDAGIGKLIRYMTQYAGGGFQGRLRTAFERSLREQLGF